MFTELRVKAPPQHPTAPAEYSGKGHCSNCGSTGSLRGGVRSFWGYSRGQRPAGSRSLRSRLALWSAEGMVSFDLYIDSSVSSEYCSKERKPCRRTCRGKLRHAYCSPVFLLTLVAFKCHQVLENALPGGPSMLHVINTGDATRSLCL